MAPGGTRAEIGDDEAGRVLVSTRICSARRRRLEGLLRRLRDVEAQQSHVGLAVLLAGGGLGRLLDARPAGKSAAWIPAVSINWQRTPARSTSATR